ncbi:hypothetical protein DEA98_16105 [Brucella pseudogrignonensis]|uniref:Phage portal protein n=1 Tax=Brucella pseudogrignonensis TaxID=419475 RepID=A0A7Y3WWA8_9HYPH|nr:hypothetical protein [Brucella pseudogrignonensis]MCM0752226.1 hypothetical protein [Brucella pseudogrignonensis]NNV19963.1 hypothetical protein [Brucella pseudogrignonensis]
MQLDFEKLATSMMLPVKGYIDKIHAAFSDSVAKLSERITKLEAVEVKEPRDGRDADPALMLKMVETTVAGIPIPKDGKDGLGFDDLDVSFDGERTFKMRFANGDNVKEFEFKAPFMLYRGVYKSGENYEQGDTVTWDGSCWVARKANADKPGDGENWQLAVKRGRNGRTSSNDDAKSVEPVRIAFKGAKSDG